MPTGPNVGFATLQVVPSMRGIQQNLQRELAGADTAKAGRTAGSRFSAGFGSSLKRMAVGIGAVVAGSKIVDFLGSTVTAASDLNETVSKASTIFGPAYADLEKWASTAATSFGQSQEQALGFAATFGNIFDQLGVSADRSARMSQQMVELASDFASFHNADITQVLEAQTAAFRGEYDALQRFVPTINAAAVEQKALEQTGKATTKELTLQEKALAVHALMMEGAGEAAGDFARTSDGLANKQRILSARMEDLRAKIGRALLPIVERATAFIADRVIPTFEEWGPKASAAITGIVGTVRVYWPQVQTVIVGAIDTVRGVIEGFVTVATTLWRNFGDNILSFVQRVWPNIRQIIEGALTLIRGVITTVTALIQGDWSKVWEGIKTVLSGAWNVIQGIVKGAIEALRLGIGAGLEVVGSMFKSAWEGIKNTAKSAVDGVVGFFRGLPGRLRDLLGSIGNAARDIGSTIINKIGEGIGNITGFIGDVASSIWEGVKDFLNRNVFDKIRNYEVKIDPPGPGVLYEGKPFGSFPRLHSGGVVPGRPGEEVFAILMAGETVLPTHKPGWNDSGRAGGVMIENLIVQTTTPPRQWLDEGLWRVAG